MRVIPLATCAAVIVIASQAAGQQEPGEKKLRAAVAPYLDIVHHYRGGQFIQAAGRLLDMETARVDAAVAALEQLAGRVEMKVRTRTVGSEPQPEVVEEFVGHLAAPPRLETDIDLADIEAAVLLHTDAAFKAWSLERRSGVTGHSGAALRLARWLHVTLGRPKTSYPKIDPSLPRLDLRDWGLAAARSLTGMLENEVALEVSRVALVWYPLDADLWLASGTAREGRARLLEVSDTAPAAGERKYRLGQEGWRSLVELRQEAERDLRRALELDPSCVEARLRLGRVLAMNNRRVEAEMEFRAVLASTADAYLRYLANLYLGRVLESRDQAAAAADCYRAAITLEPDCQACRFALAHALDTLGEEKQARAELMPLVGVQSPKPDDADGWWLYPYGRSREAARVWDELRQLVRTK